MKKILSLKVDMLPLGRACQRVFGIHVANEALIFWSLRALAAFAATELPAPSSRDWQGFLQAGEADLDIL